MKLRVLLVSNQVRGIDGTGGLGDVAVGLAKAIAGQEGVEIRVLMPGYRTVSGKHIEDRFDSVLREDIPVPYGDEVQTARICTYRLPKAASTEPDVTCYLLCMDAFEKAVDSPEQAILLARGTLEFLRLCEDFRPDVIHCNDWHTGLIPVYLNTVYANDPYLGRIATLYTTHNAGYFYQGAFPDDVFPEPAEQLLLSAGLGSWAFRPFQTRSIEHQTRFNFTKAGFGFADLINTVSITYAREIRTPAFGGGFEHLLQERSGDLCGIVNGIDVAEWSPAADTSISPFNYSKRDTPRDVRGKKQAIRNTLKKWSKDGQNPFAGLRAGGALVSLVGRLSDQKVAIMMPVLERICAMEDIQLVILGAAHPLDSHGKQFAAEMHRLAKAPGKRLLFYEGFEPELSHLIYAASDMFLMPSTYEPCGLAQLIGMRYGTVPIVRFVGGLVDTVVDEQAGSAGNGFGFREPAAEILSMADIPRAAGLLLETTKRAIRVFRNDTGRWEKLVFNGMMRDSSWAVPANQYVKLYGEAVSRRVRYHYLGR